MSERAKAELGGSSASGRPPIRVLLVNGSLRGDQGNSSRLMGPMRGLCHPRGVDVDELVLGEFCGTTGELGARLRRAEAFVFLTGCIWGSPGSVLQRFLEVSTRWEVAQEFLGKPAAVVTTMHSVGGIEAARSLAATLQLLGCMLPPLGIVVLSRIAQAALAAGEEQDTWRLADLEPLVDNLLFCTRLGRGPWAAWPVQRTDVVDGPYPNPGLVALDEPPWLRVPDGPGGDRRELGGFRGDGEG